MSRIVVLCEGDTEEVAIRHFVARQWQQDGLSAVGLAPRNLNGHSDKIKPFAADYLDETSVLAVFTLVDLYGMNLVTHASNDELNTKVERVKEWLRDQAQPHGRARDFFPHVSVHEVEAWILAEGSALSQRLRDPSIKPDREAELKNFQKPPKKRIDELFWRNRKTRYKEIADGQALFSKMAFEPVYDYCRYFREFYDELKAVAVGRAGLEGA